MMMEYVLGIIIVVLAGVLIVFLCLPMEFFLIALGIALAVAGLVLLG